MKRLAYFSLEGLKRQGPHEVWITLGTFDSADKVDRAVQTQAQEQGIVATRVMPCYRETPRSTGDEFRSQLVA